MHSLYKDVQLSSSARQHAPNPFDVLSLATIQLADIFKETHHLNASCISQSSAPNLVLAATTFMIHLIDIHSLLGNGEDLGNSISIVLKNEPDTTSPEHLKTLLTGCLFRIGIDFSLAANGVNKTAITQNCLSAITICAQILRAYNTPFNEEKLCNIAFLILCNWHLNPAAIETIHPTPTN